MNIQGRNMEQFGLCYSSLKHTVPSNIKMPACLATFKVCLNTHFFLTVLAA